VTLFCEIIKRNAINESGVVAATAGSGSVWRNQSAAK